MSFQGVEYIFHAPNVHEVMFHDVSIATLESFFVLLDDLFTASDPNQPLRMLIYTNLEMPPVAYLVAQHQKLKDRYLKLALKIAVLHPPSMQGSVISTLILMINNAINLRMFTVDKREEALVWLTR